MPTISYDADVNTDLIKNKRVAVIGYGSQGHAHASNLKDSGVDVVVGLREGSARIQRAEADGHKVMSPADAVHHADVVMVLLPDQHQARFYDDVIAGNLEPGDLLLFAHGFSIHFGYITPPESVNVAMVAPKGPGHLVRRTYQESSGVPALVAVEQDPSGDTLALALSYASAIGAGRAGIIETSFKEETETDLFGEQVVLCGGLSELVKAGFDTLTEAGYAPEMAYFECLHELKLIVDLMYEGGLSWMRHSISDTAEFGDYHTGRKIVTDETRNTMKSVLEEIQSGEFARQWMEEHRAGESSFRSRRQSELDLPIEEVGARLRDLMPFLNAKHPSDDN